MNRVLLLLLILVLGLTACGGQAEQPEPAASTAASEPASEAPLQRIRLPMGYIPDPQYAPFYVGVEKGYFAEEGLELEFDYSFETDGIALVGAGELPFAIASGEQVILARAQDLPIVYVFAWFQEFPIAVISKAETGIEEPADLVGRSVGLPGFFGASYVGYVGLLQANGLTQADVNASEIGFNQVESLLTDQIEAAVVYTNNEPVQLQARGEEINVIYVADYINMVGNGLITNEKTLAENPDLARRMVRAIQRGLTDTLADPQAAYEISKQYIEGLDDSRFGVLEASLDLWRADTLGMTDPANWENTQAVLLEMGFLDEPLPTLSDAYTNQFVVSQSSDD